MNYYNFCYVSAAMCHCLLVKVGIAIFLPKDNFYLDSKLLINNNTVKD